MYNTHVRIPSSSYVTHTRVYIYKYNVYEEEIVFVTRARCARATKGVENDGVSGPPL